MTGLQRTGRMQAEDRSETIGIVFVCWGNICRSPTAMGIMRNLVAEAGLADRIVIDSAGTSDEHAGQGPDRRTVAEARRRGLALEHRAWRFAPDHFDDFHLVLAADRVVYDRLVSRARTDADEAKIHLLRSFDPAADERRDLWQLDVPDPYMGGEEGFVLVYDLVEAACRGLLEHIRAEQGW